MANEYLTIRSSLKIELLKFVRCEQAKKDLQKWSNRLFVKTRANHIFPFFFFK